MKKTFLDLLTLTLPDDKAEALIRSDQAEVLAPQQIRELVLDGGFLERRERMRRLYEKDKKDGWGSPLSRFLDFWSNGSFNSGRRIKFPRKESVPELYGSYISPYCGQIPSGHLDKVDTQNGLYLATARHQSTGASSDKEGPVTFPARVEIKRFSPVEGQPDYVHGPRKRVFEHGNHETLDQEGLAAFNDLLGAFFRGGSEVNADNFAQLMKERGYPLAFVWDIGGDDGQKEECFGVGLPSSFEEIRSDATANGGSTDKQLRGVGISALEGGERTLSRFLGNPGVAQVAFSLELPRSSEDVEQFAGFLERICRKVKERQIFPKTDLDSVEVN